MDVMIHVKKEVTNLFLGHENFNYTQSANIL
jgi:hypothetical protein